MTPTMRRGNNDDDDDDETTTSSSSPRTRMSRSSENPHPHPKNNQQTTTFRILTHDIIVTNKSTTTTTTSTNRNKNYKNDENSCPNVSKPSLTDCSKTTRGQIIDSTTEKLPCRSRSPLSSQILGLKQCKTKRTNLIVNDYSQSTSTSVVNSSKHQILSNSFDGSTIVPSRPPAVAISSPPKNKNCNNLKEEDEEDWAKENRRRRLLQERQHLRQESPPPYRSLQLLTELDATTAAGKESYGGINSRHDREMVMLNAASITTNAADTPLAKNHAHPPLPLSSSSSSQCLQKGNVHRFLVFSSHCILLLLALFEVQDYYDLYQLGTAFDFISIMTEWVDVFHVGFVLAFSIRGLLLAWVVVTREKSRRQQHIDHQAGKKSHECVYCTVLSLLQLFAHFILAASFWLLLVPIFKDCGGNDSTRNNKVCFFIERRVLAKGRIPRRKFHVSSPRYSVFELVVRYFYKETRLILVSKIQGRLIRELLLAVVSPLAFRGRLRKLLKIIRYTSFFAPLFGTCNKFRGHLLDMIQRRKQRNASKAARKRWNDVIVAYCEQSKLDRAARTLQRRFLERRERKAQRRFALMAPHREKSNLKLACKIRRSLVEEERKSRSRLNRMAILDSQRKLKSHVSLAERRNMAQYHELERRRKRRLLLSPKTSFAVAWKYAAVACVALEISSQVFAPMLSGELKKMRLYEFIVGVIKASVPKCGDKEKKAANTSIFVPAVFGNRAGYDFCITSLWERRIHMVAHISATLIVPLVNAVFFLDVFITFFTGRLTSSGTLVPKPFFERFIFPGIGLQLIVNPTMASISRLVKQIISHGSLIGPSLFFHLLLTCAPFAAYCYDRILDLAFDFVEWQNRFISRR